MSALFQIIKSPHGGCDRAVMRSSQIVMRFAARINEAIGHVIEVAHNDEAIRRVLMLELI